MSNELINVNNLYDKISILLEASRKNLKKSVNTIMGSTYFEVGKLIVEEEQNGEERAKYGKYIIENLSKKLTNEYGKGFSTTNLKQMKSFYLAYGKGQTVSDQFKLSFSHYLVLMRMENIEEINFYKIEAIKNDWSLTEIQT